MLRVLFSCFLLLLYLATSAHAQSGFDSEAATNAQRPVRAVIELFTSQGCSSCPPADKLLKEYDGKKDVMALSLPIDYWDYIGWKDTLASPKHTQRQRRYVDTLRNGPVYTPQAVINGRVEALGSSERQIENAIIDAETDFAKKRISVHSWYNDTTVIIRLGMAPAQQDANTATIWLLQIQKRADVDIKAGENRGKTLTYTNVVREITPVGSWNGKAMTIRLPRQAIMHPNANDAAILVQEGTHGPIVGAAWLGY